MVALASWQPLEALGICLPTTRHPAHSVPRATAGSPFIVASAEWVAPAWSLGAPSRPSWEVGDVHPPSSPQASLACRVKGTSVLGTPRALTVALELCGSGRPAGPWPCCPLRASAHLAPLAAPAAGLPHASPELCCFQFVPRSASGNAGRTPHAPLCLCAPLRFHSSWSARALLT